MALHCTKCYSTPVLAHASPWRLPLTVNAHRPAPFTRPSRHCVVAPLRSNSKLQKLGITHQSACHPHATSVTAARLQSTVSISSLSTPPLAEPGTGDTDTSANARCAHTSEPRVAILDPEFRHCVRGAVGYGEWAGAWATVTCVCDCDRVSRGGREWDGLALATVVAAGVQHTSWPHRIV